LNSDESSDWPRSPHGGTIAHDLGTPLNSVLGYTQLLAQESMTERARRRLAIIETQINRMARSSALPVSTRGTPAKSEVNINELVRDTLVLCCNPISSSACRSNFGAAGTRLVVSGNGNSIQRVLIKPIETPSMLVKRRGR